MQAGTKLKTAAEVAGVWQNQGNPAMSSHTLPVRSGIALEIRCTLWEPAQLYNYKYIWLAHGRNSRCSTRLCVWCSKISCHKQASAPVLGLATCKLHCNALCCSAAKTKAPWFSPHSSGHTKKWCVLNVAPASWVREFTALPWRIPDIICQENALKYFHTLSNSSFLSACPLKVKDLWKRLYS